MAIWRCFRLLTEAKGFRTPESGAFGPLRRQAFLYLCNEINFSAWTSIISVRYRIAEAL